MTHEKLKDSASHNNKAASIGTNVDTISTNMNNMNISKEDNNSVPKHAECGDKAEIPSNKKVGTSCAQKVKHCNIDASGSRNTVSEDIEKNIIPDDILFQDPPPKEDCPLCMQPMPRIDNLSGVKQTYYQSCCGKLLCSGCVNTVVKRGFVILSRPCALGCL